MRSALLCLIALALCSSLRAQPLVLAPPVSTSAFVGDASARFDVLATSPTVATYQWQIEGAGGTWADLPEGNPYTGVTTPTLTVSSPTLALAGVRFRVVATDAAGSTTSPAATLHVHAAPAITPTATLAPASIVSTSTDPVTLTLTGLAPGSAIMVERFLDLNADGEPNPGEPCVLDATVTDGQRAAIGGVLLPFIPGDNDGTADGSITTHFTLTTSSEAARTAGASLVRVSSPTGAFRPLTRLLTLTQPVHAQSFSGHVLADGAPVPFAFVFLLHEDPNPNLTVAVLTDAAGAYTLNAPAGGPYLLFAAKIGFVGSFGSTLSLTGGQATTGQDLALTAASRTVSGSLSKETTTGAVPLGGVQLFVSGDTGDGALAFTNSDGNYSAGTIAAPSVYVEPNDDDINRLGLLRPDGDDAVTDTTAASQTRHLLYQPADALIHGTLKSKTDGTPLPGQDVHAFSNPISAPSATDATGHFYLLVAGAPGGGTRTWGIEVDHEPPLVGYLYPRRRDVTISAGEAKLSDILAYPITAHLRGRVTRDGVPVAGLQLGANPSGAIPDLPFYVGTVTDSNGDYDLGVIGDSWTIHLASVSGPQFQMVAPILTRSVADGQTLSGIDLAGKASTHVITGFVRDSNFVFLPYVEIYANALINGVPTFTSTNTDAGGNYSLPVINGTWSISIAVFYGNSTGPITTATVAGANLVRNFTRSVIKSVSGSLTRNAGQSATFTAVLDAPAPVTSLQWQTSTDGTTWTNLANDATYSGVTTAVLSIPSTTIALSGRSYRLRVVYNGNTFTSGVRTLTVNGVTPTDVWAQSVFTPAQLNDPAISGLTATPAGDGVPNLLKYAFGLPPLVPVTSPVPAPVLDGQQLTLEFDALRAELTYVVEASHDLITWSTVGVIIEVDGVQRTATYDTTGIPRAFLRVRVTQ